MPNGQITAGPTGVSATPVAPGQTTILTTTLTIHTAQPQATFGYQIFRVATDESIGGHAQSFGANQLTAGATVTLSAPFTVPAGTPDGAYRVELYANADSDWSSLYNDPNAAAFAVQATPANPVVAGPTSASPSIVAPGQIITFATDFAINANLPNSSFGYQIFSLATNQSIGGHTESKPASALVPGASVSIAFPFVVPAGTDSGAYRVEVFANVDSDWSSLYNDPNAKTFNVQPLTVSIFPKIAGAFVNWGTAGRESNMAIWESWLNQTPSSVLAMDFYNSANWNDFTSFTWLPGFWKNANPQRKLVWSISLTVPGTPLADIAAGTRDADFQALAEKIAEAQPDAIIRLGWEMNVSSMAWFAGGQEATYIAAFRRIVPIFRAASPAFKIDWCPSWATQNSPADLAYPGDDVVDIIGLDIYDYPGSTSVEQRWIDYYLDGPFGLNWHKTFAIAHGKPMSYPEWGVGAAGDNPYFVQKMYDWFVQNAAHIAYACYFDVDGAWNTQIDNNSFPQSQALFHTLFTRP